MRYLTYRKNGSDRPGFGVGELVVDGARALATAGMNGNARVAQSTRQILELSNEDKTQLGEAAAQCAAAGDGLGLEEVELGPPVPDPEKIIGLGLNYPTHAVEFGGPVPEAPQLFPKFPPSLTGPYGTIELPAAAPDEVDFEGELAVVIGCRCRNVPADEALNYVAGAMAFNDVTARDLQHQTSQWTAGKAIDTFAPCGPAVVSLDEVGDIGDLRVRTHVNGSLMQDGTTAEMLFDVPNTIAFVSGLMTLVPGDIIATGTPTGVGFRRDPPVYLGDGDIVEVEVERVGKITNPVASQAAVTGRKGTPREARVPE